MRRRELPICSSSRSPGSADALGRGPWPFDETAGHDKLSPGGDQCGVQDGGELKVVFGDEGNLCVRGQPWVLCFLFLVLPHWFPGNDAADSPLILLPYCRAAATETFNFDGQENTNNKQKNVHTRHSASGKQRRWQYSCEVQRPWKLRPKTQPSFVRRPCRRFRACYLTLLFSKSPTTPIGWEADVTGALNSTVTNSPAVAQRPVIFGHHATATERQNQQGREGRYSCQEGHFPNAGFVSIYWMTISNVEKEKAFGNTTRSRVGAMCSPGKPNGLIAAPAVPRVDNIFLRAPTLLRSRVQ